MNCSARCSQPCRGAYELGPRAEILSWCAVVRPSMFDDYATFAVSDYVTSLLFSGQWYRGPSASLSLCAAQWPRPDGPTNARISHARRCAPIAPSMSGTGTWSSSFRRRKCGLMSKKPEIQKCLDAINLLVDKREEDEDVEVDFPLADQVYARARVHKDAGYVGLWLGAGVMVEYGLEEAKGLLEEQLVSCEQQLTEVDEDWGYVADQTTTTQVTLARLYNHSVELARR
jgi:prefoldin subunit 5